MLSALTAKDLSKMGLVFQMFAQVLSIPYRPRMAENGDRQPAAMRP
jgi:hypothetical protein